MRLADRILPPGCAPRCSLDAIRIAAGRLFCIGIMLAGVTTLRSGTAAAALRAAGAEGVAVPANASAPVQFETLDGAVQALMPFGGELVVAGSFATAGALATGPVARWTGSGWAPLGAAFDGPVEALAVVQGQLVAGGAFAHVGGVEAANIARWNGGTWEPLGAGTNGPVRALAVQANVVLFVGGSFDQAGGVEAHGVARWIAGNWSAVGNGVDGAVYALTVYDGALVAAGDFGTRDSGGLDVHLARFTGGMWRTLALGVDAPVFAVAVYQGSLVAGGAFTAIDLVTRARGIARLTGDSWSEVGVGVTTDVGPAEVRTLYVSGADLIAGGSFQCAGLEPVNNIAHWNGVRWNALEQGTDGPVAALAEDGDGLVVGGSFAHAGGTAAGRIAAFRSGRWATLDETAIAVRDVAVRRDVHGVQLQWALDRAAAAALRGVWVERATGRQVDGVRVTMAPLPVAVRMSIVDAVPDAAAPWYRIVLIGADGREAVGAAIQAPDAARARASSLGAIDRSPGGEIAVNYTIGAAGAARLDLYDVHGRLLAVLAGGPHAAGAYRAVWSPRDGAGPALARGVYFARLRAVDGEAARKFVIRGP